MKKIKLITGLVGIIGLGATTVVTSCSNVKPTPKPKPVPNLDEFRIDASSEDALINAIVPFKTFANTGNYFTYNNVSYNKSTISKVTFSPKQNDIPYEAFYGCHSLLSIDLANVAHIGGFAFAYCTGIESISLRNVTAIDNNAFFECTGLSHMDIAIDNSIYQLIDSTAGATFGLPVTSTENGYLHRVNDEFGKVSATAGNDGGLACGDIKFAENVNTVGVAAFDGCTSIGQLDLNRVAIVSENAFRYCNNITSIVSPSLMAIGKSAFSYSGIFTSINLTSAFQIGDDAFVGCSLLAAIDLGNRDSEPEFFGADIFQSVAKVGNVTVSDD
jgi:hypothetical protein